ERDHPAARTPEGGRHDRGAGPDHAPPLRHRPWDGLDRRQDHRPVRPGRGEPRDRAPAGRPSHRRAPGAERDRPHTAPTDPADRLHLGGACGASAPVLLLLRPQLRVHRPQDRLPDHSGCDDHAADLGRVDRHRFDARHDRGHRQAVGQRHRLRPRHLLHLAFPRPAPAHADLHHLSGPAAAGLRRRARHRRDRRPVALLRSLHDRDLPRGHPEHRPRPVRGGDRAGPQPHPDAVARGHAAGDAGHHPADGQPVHLHAQGLVARLGRGRVGAHVPRPDAGADRVSPHRDAVHRLAHLLGALHGAGIWSVPAGEALRAVAAAL
ncbi:MAG: ABC transporter, permease protein (cluster 3, basic aa/glutamine/opines), partial [uncultured Rubellimicrobium sp.]